MSDTTAPHTNFNDIHPNLLSNDTFKFSHGLTGTDQPGNYRSTNAALIGFAGLFITLLILRISQSLHAGARQSIVASNPSRQLFWESNILPWLAWLQRHLGLAPIFRRRLHQEIQLKRNSLGTLPTRLQSILLVLYILSNIAYCLTVPSTGPEARRVAALRGRSGHLATFNLIFLILFALRNNPLIWILDISFDTFNFCHRWVARIMTIEALIHTICWMHNTHSAGGWHGLYLSLDGSLSYRWGLAATFMFLIIFFQALSPIRRPAYTVFLALHRPLAFGAVLGTFLHLHYHNLPQLPYLYLVFAFLTAEYILRGIRTVWISFDFRSRKLARVTVQALPGDASRVTIHLAHQQNPPAGSQARLYIPSLDLLGSHPFSVAWSENRARERIDEEQPMRADEPSTWSRRNSQTTMVDEVNLRTLAPGKPSSPRLPATWSSRGLPKSDLVSPLASPRVSLEENSRVNLLNTITPASFERPRGANINHGPSMSMICRKREGFTKRLYDRAAKAPIKTFSTWALIEGFYGVAPSLNSYGTVLLFAGGVGITHQLPHFRELVKGYAAGTSSVQQLKLIWSIPSTACLDWIRDWMDEIYDTLHAAEVASVTVYISRKSAESYATPAWADIRWTRADPDLVLGEAIRARVGAMAVTVCGPGALSDGVRAAARKRVTQCSLDFVEEAFSY